MPLVDRFTVSLDTELLAAFDGYMSSRGYVNRSEAIRDLIREALATGATTVSAGEVIAVLTGICDAGISDAANRLRIKLAACSAQLLTHLNFPLDDRRSAIVIVLRGATPELRSLTEEIQAMRGVMHGKTSVIAVNAPARTAGGMSDTLAGGMSALKADMF